MATNTATADLYDLWLNSMLPAVAPSRVAGVTSSSSHQIDNNRLAEKLLKLMELGMNESAAAIVEIRT